MNPDLEKKPLNQEDNESLSEQESVILDKEGFEKLSQEAEKEINSYTEALVNKGSEFFDDVEIKDYPEVKELEGLNQEIKNLQKEASDSILWIRDRFNLDKSKKETFLEIEIQGTDEFREKIKNSLKFLSLAPEKLNFSQKYIKRIQEWGHSGMNMFKDRPTFEIGDLWKDFDEIYLASAIAHDSFHSHLCIGSEDSQGNISLGAYVGKEAEKKCLDFQIKTLEDMGTNDYMKDYQEIIEEYKNGLKELMINPTYQDIPYEERNW